ncbi:MAG: hypothetical protein ACLFWR_06550, partial [Acidimicrobiales bacterium]
MTTNDTTPIAKAQTAAQDLLNRTQDATRQFVETLTESTERLSTEITSNAKNAAEQADEARERVAGELRSKAEPTAEQVTGAVNELISWARRNSDRLIADLDEFRSELGSRLAPVTVVTKADLAALEARVSETEAKLAKALKATSTTSGSRTKSA